MAPCFGIPGLIAPVLRWVPDSATIFSAPHRANQGCSCTWWMPAALMWWPMLAVVEREAARLCHGLKDRPRLLASTKIRNCFGTSGGTGFEICTAGRATWGSEVLKISSG